MGSKIYGQGFTMSPEERESLARASEANGRRIFPYLGGDEVNSISTQSHHRYVINFGPMAVEEADQWPDLMKIARTTVKPEREQLRNDTGPGKHARKHWWQHLHPRPPLYAAITQLSRCLVNSQVSKHLVFAFQPTGRVFSHALNVFALEHYGAFSTMQSRLHDSWARLLCSTLATLEDRAGTARLRYAASDCFETFPLPEPNPRTVIPELDTIGEKLYETRAKYMVDTDQGLTKTYNALKNPACTDERIIELRHLHEEMDRAVLRACRRLEGVGSNDPNIVGWSDIEVPPFCIATDGDKAALQAFEDEVIDRLFVLNELRAKEEAAQGKQVGGKPSKKAQHEKAAKKGATPDDQGNLF